MDTEVEMEKPEERNDDEARTADEESLYLVQLGPSTPVQLEEGKLLAAMKAHERHFRHGRIEPSDLEADFIRVRQADQAYKDREAERKRVLLTAWAPIVKYVASAMAMAWVSATLLVYRLT